MKHRAIALLSGGLDSTLAARLIMDQGIEVHGFSVVTPFSSRGRGERYEAQNAAEQLGIPIQMAALTDEFLQILKHPKHGFGSGMNPCIDCRILLLLKAREVLQETGAEFVFTGEVLGQRPMSQHLRAMQTVGQESGLQGLLLRPLSAKLLEPTVPEKEGIVDREKLLAIQGRSRKTQMSLAQQYGITDYPTPAGGCRLAEPNFARRMRDLSRHETNYDVNDVTLLRFGRHFRLSNRAKAIVGRNEQENERLQELARPDDALLEVPGWGSPLTVLRGSPEGDERQTAAALTARYSDAPGPQVLVSLRCAENGTDDLIAAPSIDERELVDLLI